MLHELAKHPKVQERLHEEVTTILGTEGVPDERSYQRLTFAKCIIKEALRLVCKCALCGDGLLHSLYVWYTVQYIRVSAVPHT